MLTASTLLISGQGCHLTSIDGHEYLDILGEYTAGIHGHSNPKIIAAIKETVDNGINISHNSLEPILAKHIVGRFKSIELVRFTNSGTEANLMAIAAAITFTGRKKVMVFCPGYHGGVLSFRGKNNSSPINVPHEYIFGKYNDVEGSRELIRENGKDIAAVVLEPMLGSAGAIPGSKAFISTLRDETSKAGALLIFDEVITSRLAWGGLQDELDIMPDMTTLGKYLGGGMTFGAFGGRKDIMNLFNPTISGSHAHSGTFNNNVVSMSAGIAGASVLTKDVLRQLNELGDQLRTRLDQTFKSKTNKIWMSGIGSVMVPHFGKKLNELTTQEIVTVEDDQLKDLFFLDMLEERIYMGKQGFIALMIPMTEDDVNRVVKAVEKWTDRRKMFL
ncbi:unnamed protein product [Didymodactylos carnosus]|uniref:Uncharacterized protein n=2 Tax=Didymodactylos carnosus TaxID=1234261 RepID=A0A8S2E3M3_9BILA|nr:unnamed protein product [Didymodactylos carnosus]CAF3836441.1 unnamed protein product [Didymodactylos carnosus]